MVPISTIDNHILANTIISTIKAKLGVLPEKGILAGQAVASAVYEFVGSYLRGQYNDADIYVDTDYAYRGDKGKCKGLDDKNITRKPSLNRYGANASVHASMYAFEVGKTVKTGYSITGVGYSTDNKHVNFIQFVRVGTYESEESVAQLIQVFWKFA